MFCGQVSFFFIDQWIESFWRMCMRLLLRCHSNMNNFRNKNNVWITMLLSQNYPHVCSLTSITSSVFDFSGFKTPVRMWKDLPWNHLRPVSILHAWRIDTGRRWFQGRSFHILTGVLKPEKSNTEEVMLVNEQTCG